MADILEETWFIGVMAGVGAIVVILIIIIFVLCCLWFRKVQKRDELEQYENNNKQVATDDENWTLAKPDRNTTPPSSNSSSQIIRGNEPIIAGSSLIHMDKEMRSNGGTHISTQTIGTQTTMERALEGNRYVDAFPANGDLGRAAELNSSARFSRSEFRSSYQNPRMANISVSSVKRNQSSYNYNAPVASPYPYRIPSEDYENSSIMMYTPEERTSRASSTQKITSEGKVKEIATHYERRESFTVPPTSPSQIEVQNEIRELKEHERTAPIKKRLSNRTTAAQAPQKRVSSYINEEYYEDDEPQYSSNVHHHASWQVKSGKSTIDTRVDRYKKVGAVSVFPD